jgi:formylglycine-generating enzyme required for sulfatase activity/serine/threonine protein kinase
LAAAAALLLGSCAVTSANDPLGLVGTTIAGKYAIESVVGQGGFATVFRAQHVLWKRPVAVKVFTVLGDVAEDQRDQLLADFIQEGALLAELSEKSTAIVQARDIGMFATSTGDSVPYMVLEWLDGRTLETVLAQERAGNAALRSLEDTLRLLDPVAEALALAHSKGIAHRDVKPANIFVLGATSDAQGAGGTGGVKLLDFGIAKVVQDVQKMGFGKTAGHITSFTPLYGAPEQFNRQYGSTGPWTDVFALALVVAEIRSGKEPMSGDSLVQLAYASADEKTRPTPRTLGVATSDEVEAIFRKAVAVKPEERFANCADFWNALRATVLGDRLSSIASARMSVVGAAPATTEMFVDTIATSGPPADALADSQKPTAGVTPKSRTPLLIAGVAAAIALAAGGWIAVQSATGSGKAVYHPAPLPTVTASAGTPRIVATASAAAAAAGKQCPPGMILIPGGEFFMGSEEKDALDTEKPPHRVRLTPYCIDELEMTVAQYKECSDRGGCRRAGKENVWPGINDVQRKIYDPLCNIADPVGKAKHPINCIDWDQAREACESRGGRLPTEAEWEFAARGPDGRVYPWGDEPPNALLLNACGKECVAWQKKHRDPDNTPALMYDDDDGFPNTSPVGSFPKGKSRYGLQDVVGNVWEWVADFYADYDKATASSTVTDPKGPATAADRVIRGGAWNGAQPSWVRPSFRFHVAPGARSYGFGFRCAKSP